MILLASSALAALALVPGVPWPGLVVLALSLAFQGRLAVVARWRGTLTAAGLALCTLGLGVVGPVAALGCAVAGLVTVRVLGRRGPTDDPVLLLLSVMALILAASRTTSVLFLLPLAGVAAGGALLLLGRRGLPVGLAIVAATALLFPLLPRLGGAPPPAPMGAAVTGFSAEASLGDLDALLVDPTPVLRVRTDAPGPLMLRGAVLDRFDGRRWTRGQAREPLRIEQGGTLLQVEELSLVENVLFTLGPAVGADASGEVRTDRDGGLWIARGAGLLTYRTWSLPGASLDDVDRWRLTALPDLDGRVRALAQEVAPEADGLVLAEALRARLLADYTYTRSPRDADTEDPLAHFLFERRAGHCEYFASALAVLLRTRGVPTRLVNGFAGGEPNPFDGTVLFRRLHAHSWVEVYDNGWHVVDATPGAGAPAGSPMIERFEDAVQHSFDQWVVDYDSGVQWGLAIGAGHWLEGLVLPADAGTPWVGLSVEVLLLGGVLALLWLPVRLGIARVLGERQPRPRGRVARAHRAAWRSLRKKGWRPPAALPPVQAAQWVRDRVGEGARPLEDLAWLLYEVRYGGRADAELAGRAWELARAVRGLRGPTGP